MVGEAGGFPDETSLYCKRLGHPVPFKYCRLTIGDRPCESILSCWGEHPLAGDAARGIASEITPAVRPDKRVQLFDLIKKAQEG